MPVEKYVHPDHVPPDPNNPNPNQWIYEPPKPKKKRVKPGGNNPSGLAKPKVMNGQMDAEIIGNSRRPHPWHMSVNELLEYKASGLRPALIINEDIVFKLAQIGVSLENTAEICGVGMTFFTEHKNYHNAWKLGRAEVGAKIRASLVEDALVKDVLNAKIYLDKTMNAGEAVQSISVEHSVKQANPLENVPTQALLNVLYKEDDPSNP
jgi:hypothetical protein